MNTSLPAGSTMHKAFKDSLTWLIEVALAKVEDVPPLNGLHCQRKWRPSWKVRGSGRAPGASRGVLSSPRAARKAVTTGLAAPASLGNRKRIWISFSFWQSFVFCELFDKTMCFSTRKVWCLKGRETRAETEP